MLPILKKKLIRRVAAADTINTEDTVMSAESIRTLTKPEWKENVSAVRQGNSRESW